MKTIKVYVCAILIALPFFASAQELASVVETVKKANQVPEFIQVRNQLERFSMNQPQEWLPYYYMAYADIQLSFMLPSKDDKKRYLTDAQSCLAKLTNLSGANQSEVYTLKGFRLYALIASDPQTNGPLYYGELTACYDKALALNANNPRALILSALFKNDMAKFMHQSYPDFQKEIEKAATLFAAEDTATVNPTWGKAWLDRAKAQK